MSYHFIVEEDVLESEGLAVVLVLGPVPALGPHELVVHQGVTEPSRGVVRGETLLPPQILLDL